MRWNILVIAFLSFALFVSLPQVQAQELPPASYWLTITQPSQPIQTQLGDLPPNEVVSLSYSFQDASGMQRVAQASASNFGTTPFVSVLGEATGIGEPFFASAIVDYYVSVRPRDSANANLLNELVPLDMTAELHASTFGENMPVSSTAQLTLLGLSFAVSSGERSVSERLNVTPNTPILVHLAASGHIPGLFFPSWTPGTPIFSGFQAIADPVFTIGLDYQFRDEFVVEFSPNMTVTPVPEPETYAMLLAGLALLAFWAKRRLHCRLA